MLEYSTVGIVGKAYITGGITESLILGAVAGVGGTIGCISAMYFHKRLHR